MTMNFDAIEAYKESASRRPRKPAEWSPPVLGDFARGKVLAVDQSLGATGLVALVNDGTLRVEWTAIYSTKDDGTGAGGHEVNLVRALQLGRMFRQLFANLPGAGWVVVHEAPATGGGKIQRPESSLLAAAMLRTEAEHAGVPIAPMVQAQEHKRATCGKPNATKMAHKPPLMELAADLGIVNLDLVSNEAKRDALSIGLTYLLRRESG